MLQLSVDPQLKQAAPRVAVGVLTCGVQVTPYDEALWREIDAHTPLFAGLTMEQARQRPGIAALRAAYRALGVDPTRYRGSNEALVRRLVQGKALYRVNTVVDINNVLSLETLCSCGAVDLDRIAPPVVFRPGREGESYAGIGRGLINLAGLPVFADAAGPFASTTSDCERTKVTLETRRIVLLVISFGGREGLDEALRRAAELLARHAAAREVETTLAE